MKIVIVSPIATHPQSAGHRSRVFFLSKNLTELGHDVHLIYLRTQRQAKDDDLPAMQRTWPNLTCLDYTEGGNAQRKYGAVNFDSLRDVDDWFDDTLETPLRILFEKIRPQAVLAVYAPISKVLDYLSFPSLKVLDTHDVHANRNEQLGRHGIAPSGWYSFSDEEEKKALGRADLILAIQRHDAAHFRTITGSRVEELGLWTPVKNVFSAAPDSARLAFFSSANQVGLANFHHFYRKIWPLIKRRRPETRLAIAGKVCAFIRTEDPNIELLGYQEDLAGFFGGAGLVVSAEVFATGISTKNMTAMGFGMPLITTPSGARGLDDACEKVFLTAHTPEEFADLTLSVLQDPSKASSLSRNAQDFIRLKNDAYIKTLKRLFP